MAVPSGFKSWQEYVNKHIAECEDCAPYFQGEGQMSAEGRETEVSWLPLELGLPDRVSRRVIENAVCEGCGSNVSEMINVWLRPPSEVEFRAQVDLVIGRYGARIIDFREFLTRHPYLGARHPMGRALIRAVAKIRPAKAEGKWFRCLGKRKGKRALSPEDFRAPQEDQESPISEGRFNHAGQAHWYLADSDMTAIAEVLDGSGGVVWTQQFKIESCDKILDVSRSIQGDFGAEAVRPIESVLALVMMGALDGDVERNRAWKPGYLVPRFVMDAAKLAGFEGIRYRSTRASKGENIVLFRRDWPAKAVGKRRRHIIDEPEEFRVIR